MEGTDDTVTNQILAMATSNAQLDMLYRMANTIGHYSCSVGKHPKVVKLMECDHSTLIEINEVNGDYYGVYSYHWIDEVTNTVSIQVYLKGFSCGFMNKIKSLEPTTFTFTEEEFSQRVYIHRKKRGFNMDNCSIIIQDIIKRHEEKGFTRTDAIKFYNQVTLLMQRGALTQEEGLKLLREGTIDCIG